MFNLTGKVAVMTGAASGIGAAVVARFRRAGTRVVGMDVQPAPQTGGDFILSDVSKADDIAMLLDHAIERHGRLNIVVNNAGIVRY